MRSRFSHLACLLLLLSSLAVVDVRVGGAEASRTPGGVFVRNLLLQAAVEEAEAEPSGFAGGRSRVEDVPALPRVARRVDGAAMRTAHVHAVTGNSL